MQLVKKVSFPQEEEEDQSLLLEHLREKNKDSIEHIHDLYNKGCTSVKKDLLDELINTSLLKQFELTLTESTAYDLQTKLDELEETKELTLEEKGKNRKAVAILHKPDKTEALVENYKKLSLSVDKKKASFLNLLKSKRREMLQ
jgi:hypothetical protein